MKKYLIGMLATMFLLLFAFWGTVGAAYDSSNDLRISLNTKLIPIKLSSKTGNLMFNVQEKLHNSLTDITSVEIDHSYIWITVNGEDIAAIDPPKPMFN